MGCSALGLLQRYLVGAWLGLWPAAAAAQGAAPSAPGSGAAGAAEPAPAAEPSLARAPAPAPRAAPSVSNPSEQPPAVAPQPAVLEPDFLTLASPWVDFSFTSFYFERRAGNFLNLGVQFGMYAFERLRLAGRLVTPLGDVTDNYGHYIPFAAGGSQSGRVASRSLSLLYGASVGLAVTNSRSFVFGPSLTILRTDVEDYGTAVLLSLPFEWTTPRSLRVGFELALGHAVGGTSRTVCVSGAVSCGGVREERPGGTSVLFQYYMGWALGSL